MLSVLASAKHTVTWDKGWGEGTAISTAEFFPVTTLQQVGKQKRGEGTHDQIYCFWDFRPRDPHLRKEKKARSLRGGTG